MTGQVSDPAGYCATLMRATEARCRRRAIAQAWRAARRRPIPPSAVAIADKLEPAMRRRFLAAVAAAHGAVDLEALARAIQQQSAREVAIAAQLDDFPDRLTLTAAVATTAFQRTGQATASVLGDVLALPVSFQLTNPRAVAWARQNAARFVTQVGVETQQAIRTVVGDMFEQGIPPVEAARTIRTLVGLTERQAQAVMTYQADLAAAGRAAEAIARLGASYSRQLLNQRATLIARTETIQAANQGQQELWRQAVDAGILNPETARRRWLTSDDERVCPICEPMADQEVGLEEPFLDGEGQAVMLPPVHVACRCATALVP